MIFGAADYPWLVPHWESHGLRPVKIGILERCQANSRLASDGVNALFSM
jgi:hypothetical protein